MESLIGATLVWFLGNKDLIKLLAVFVPSISIVYIFLVMGGRRNERI